jgi:CRISPR/Cas system-associated exonuclease Cas4 (RecB family)
MEHSIFSPSKLERIMLCPGSANIQEESVQNKHAAKGTLLHRYVEEADDVGIENVEMEENDRILVQECLDYKNSIINSMGHDEYTTASESLVSLSHLRVPDVFGTLDYNIIDIRNKHLHIIDWKFGYILVYANMNPQELAYAAGVLNTKYDIEFITLHIFQPSRDHIDTYTITPEKLLKWVKKLSQCITLAQSKNPPVVPGEIQCKWCPIAASCKARYKQASQDAKNVFATIQALPKEITSKQVSSILKVIPRLQDYIKQIQVFATQELEHGNSIPGYKLVSGRSIRKWSVDENEIIAWCDKHIPDIVIFETNLKSISKFEKADKSLKKNKGFQKLIIKPQGKAILAEISDKRAAIQPSSVAIDVFDEYKI